MVTSLKNVTIVAFSKEFRKEKVLIIAKKKLKEESFKKKEEKHTEVQQIQPGKKNSVKIKVK